MRTKNSGSRAAISKIPHLEFLSLSARVLNEDCHQTVGSLTGTSGLARQNAVDHSGVHVSRGHDYPNAGTQIPNRFATANRCTKNKSGVQYTYADGAHKNDTFAGANSLDQRVTAKRSKDGVQEANEDRRDGDDPHADADSRDRCVAAKRCKRSKNGGKETNAVGLHHFILIDEAKDDGGYGIAPEASSSINRYHERPPDSRGNLTAATKEHCFLNSRDTGGQFSMDLEDCTGEEFCIKCDGSGQLLICNGNSCPLVVHQSCLGCEASFDNMGNFYCPFCSYKCAVAEFQGAKKELDSAKNALSMFLGTDVAERGPGGTDVAERVPGCQRQPDPSIACREEANEEETNLDGNAIHISQTKGNDVPEKIFDKSQSKSGAEQIQAQCGIEHESNVTPTAGELTHQVSHQESMEGQLQKEASVVYRGNDLPCGENLTALHETTDVSMSKRRSKRRRYNQNVFEEQPSIGETEDEMFAKVVNGLETVNSPGRDAETVSTSQRHVEGRTQETTVQPWVVDSSQASAIKLKISGDENNGDENEDGALEKSINLQGATKQCSKPESPNLGRRKRLWTAEEEEMLKDGVQKFSGTVAKNLPWRKILEYGRHVFDETRTPAELKDKWRRNLLVKEGARKRDR